MFWVVVTASLALLVTTQALSALETWGSEKEPSTKRGHCYF